LRDVLLYKERNILVQAGTFAESYNHLQVEGRRNFGGLASLRNILKK
jgi:hypothetical protein